ncbi:MAG: S1 family peptidase [Candidatus Izimaplasma sp.]|nr:S1 family peptidase [Candidatus Izimaplasma bacterium]
MKRFMVFFMITFLIVFTNVVDVNANIGLGEAIKKQEKLLREYSVFMSQSKGHIGFEDEFGGAYFDDNDELVINVVSSKKNQFLNKNDISSEFRIREVKYSLQIINSAIPIVEKLIDEGIAKSVSRSEKDNTLIVGLWENDVRIKEQIIELTGLENMIFKISKSNLQTALTVRYAINGTSAQIDMYTFATIGFAARNSSGDDGFVTTGHGIQDGDDVNCDGHVIYTCGDVRQNSFADGSDSDAAFVELRDNWYNRWDPSYNFMNGDFYTNVISSTTTLDSLIVQNMTVTAYGDESGRQFGEVLETYYTDTVGNVELVGFVKCDYIAILGDSGAAVTAYVYNPSYGYPTRHVIGLQSYSNLEEITFNWVSGSYSVFSRADNIYDDLNITSY